MFHGDPQYKPCPQCSEYRILDDTRDIETLIAGDYGMKPMSHVSFAEIDSKPGAPEGWFDHVIDSITQKGFIFDPIGLVRREQGLIIVEGHHRAWTAITYGIRCSATIFDPVCGVCTEALFIDSIHAWTRAKGWLYHQQFTEKAVMTR